MRVEDLAPVMGNRIVEPGVAATGGIGRCRARWLLPDIARQERQEALGQVQRLGVAVGREVDHAAVAMHLVVSAEVVLVDIDAERLLHHRRAGREHLALAAHHDRQMRGGDPQRTEAGTRTVGDTDNGHGAQQVGDRQQGITRNLGVAELVEQLHTAAGAVDHANDRQLVFPGITVGVDPLFRDRRLRRSAANGEVIRRDHGASLLDLAHANHRRARCGRSDLALGRVFHGTGEDAEFLEAFAIEQVADAFTRREFALGMMLLHCFRAAQCIGNFAASADVGEFPGPFRGNRRAHDDVLCRRAR
ncbi:hypothetical protein D3C73_598010 [compost metagenome]